MALQSDGSISIADIATEFGGDVPHGLNEYYDVATGLPVSGTIGLAHFYGTTAAAAVNYVTDSLVWHLDAASSSNVSGTTWSDLIGSQNATLVNSPTYSNEGGGAFHFNGTTQYMSTNFAPSPLGDWSASAWFKPEDQTGAWGWFMNTFSGGGSAEWWSLGMQYLGGTASTGYPTWMIDEGGTKVTIQSTTALTSDWQMMTGTRQGSDMFLYINGTQVASSSTLSTDTVVNSAFPLTIGTNGQAVSNQLYKGYISDLKVYTKSLSPAEVTQNYNALKDRYIPAAVWTNTWDLATDWPTLSDRVVQTESLRIYTGNIAGQSPYDRSKHTWSADGYFLYVSGADYWLQREVSTPYDASPSAVVEDKSVHLTATGNPTTPIGNDRLRKYFHVVNNGNNTVSYLGHENGYLSYGKTLYMDDLATANDITSVSFTTTNYYDMGNDIVNGSNGPEQVQFTQKGTVMYVLFHLGLEYNSSTGQFNADNGTNSKSSIIKYTLSTAWDLTTASTTSTSFYNFSSPGGYVGLSFAMNPDETEFFAFVEQSSTEILMLEFNIPTAGDLSSIPAYIFNDPTNVYRRLFDGVNQDTRSLTMSPDGKTITTWAGTAHIVVNLENQATPPGTPIGLTYAIYGDQPAFEAHVTSSSLDTTHSDYVALNHPAGKGNTWSIVDGSYAILNNPYLANDSANNAFNATSDKDLSDGMTFQFWAKWQYTQPPTWENVLQIDGGNVSGSGGGTLIDDWSYNLWQTSSNQLAIGGNGGYLYYHPFAGTDLTNNGDWFHMAVELQTNGRHVHYINGAVAVNETATDLSGLTTKANVTINGIHAYITDIEFYSGGGIHNPTNASTPPGFTPPARKQI